MGIERWLAAYAALACGCYQVHFGPGGGPTGPDGSIVDPSRPDSGPTRPDARPTIDAEPPPPPLDATVDASPERRPDVFIALQQMLSADGRLTEAVAIATTARAECESERVGACEVSRCPETLSRDFMADLTVIGGRGMPYPLEHQGEGFYYTDQIRPQEPGWTVTFEGSVEGRMLSIPLVVPTFMSPISETDHAAEGESAYLAWRPTSSLVVVYSADSFNDGSDRQVSFACFFDGEPGRGEIPASLLSIWRGYESFLSLRTAASNRVQTEIGGLYVEAHALVLSEEDGIDISL